MSRADKYAAIPCPRQRAVARRVGRCLDVWSVQFAGMAPEERLWAFTRSANDSERWRNLVRVPALGMVQRLGRDLGLSVVDLHGEAPATVKERRARKRANKKLPVNKQFSPLRAPGKTLVPELVRVQRTTAISACALFDALVTDKGDVPSLVASHYREILADARREVEAAEGPEFKGWAA